MKNFLRHNIGQIIVGLVVAGSIAVFTAYAGVINKEIDSKVSKESVESMIIRQESNVDLIKKDIKHIEHLLEDQNIDFKERFERLEDKLDQLILNNN